MELEHIWLEGVDEGSLFHQRLRREGKLRAVPCALATTHSCLSRVRGKVFIHSRLSQISPSAVHAGMMLQGLPITPIIHLDGQRKPKGYTNVVYLGAMRQFLSNQIASTEQTRSIVGYSVLQDLPVPTPLCKPHYHIIYDTLQPKQTHCPTCGSSLRTTATRLCPDRQRIQQYLTDKTGYEGEIPEGSKLCYKSHLLMLKRCENN